jgi:cytochrome c oxidase subunit 2
MSAPKIDIDSIWLPKASSTLAGSVDQAWDWAMLNGVVFFLIVMLPLAYFVVKYKRRSDKDVTSPVAHNTLIETIWTVIPTAICIALFFVGLAGYIGSSVAPKDAFEINVTAQKWSWTFTYPNGTVSAGKLVVPKGRPVRLVMSSVDVIHSFFVPEFRVKQDVIPGQYTSVWFEATEAKETAVLCTEYCGNGHSEMMATVEVLEPQKFDEWLETGGEDNSVPPAERGKQLFTQWSCNTCHSIDGSKGIGPSFQGLFGKDETLMDGSTAKVDENYVRESILQSTAKVVKGYAPIMPVFQGQLKDAQVDALVAYIKTLK